MRFCKVRDVFFSEFFLIEVFYILFENVWIMMKFECKWFEVYGWSVFEFEVLLKILKFKFFFSFVGLVIMVFLVKGFIEYCLWFWFFIGEDDMEEDRIFKDFF